MKVFIKILKIMAGIVLGLVLSFVTIVCINAYEESSFQSLLYPWLIALIIAGWVSFMIWLMLRKPSAKKTQTQGLDDFPVSISEFIDEVVKAMKYRKKIRADVREELTAHFTDALTDCEKEDEKQKAAEALISEFGNVKLLGKLMRRAKKRCRPLWKQALFSVLKVIGVIILLLLLRVGYMATGRPTISIDYTQWMNDKVRDGRDESLNAHYDYQKAIELIHKEMSPEVKKIDATPWKQQKTPEEWQAIEAFLETEAKAFEVFRAGATKPYYWNIYQSPEEQHREDWQIKIEKERSPDPFWGYTESKTATRVVEGLMPKMSGYKKLAYWMGHYQIPFDIHQGNTKQAVNDCIALYHFGQHISSQGVVIEQLVGTAIKAIAMQAMRDHVLSQTELSADNLLRLQQVIEKDYNPDKAPIDWGLEKAFWYDEIQRSFTDDGRGNGRPSLRGISFSVGSQIDIVKGLATGFPDRKEVISVIGEAFERFDELRNLTPLMMQGTEDLLDVDKLVYMQKISAPAVKKTIEISWRLRVGQAGLTGTLSIFRFEKENGRWPEDWNELIEEGYLKTVLSDPYSDQSLIYRKSEDSFLLYSVGSNLTNDGGIPGSDKNGKYRQWGEQGDWIFWPVRPVNSDQ